MQIPADMVVNAMIMAMVAHANTSSRIIFHVSSSLRNPMKLCSLRNFMFRYFTLNPWIDKNGKSINFRKGIVFSSIAKFQAYMAIRYKLPLKVCFWLITSYPKSYTCVLMVSLFSNDFLFFKFL
jgi:fatty acyl-CoA reductase